MKKTTLCYLTKGDEVLLLHRVKKENDENKDKWIGIGGHFEAGETPKDCIVRECREETGAGLTALKFRGVIDFVSDTWPEDWMYLFTCDDFTKVKRECDEGDLAWVEKKKLPDLNFWEGDYIFLRLCEERDYPGILCREEEDPTAGAAAGHVPEGCFSLKLVYAGETLKEAVLFDTPLELLDVVDEDGKPTGKVRERGVAHSLGTLHRTSHVWIVRKNEEGKTEILLQKRSAQKDAFPGCLDISSAGHIPAGTDFRESAVRELREELGITAEEDELSFIGMARCEERDVFHGKPFFNREVSAVFLYEKEINEKELVLQKEEVESVKWMELDACIDGVIHRTFKNCLLTNELYMIRKAY